MLKELFEKGVTDVRVLLAMKRPMWIQKAGGCKLVQAYALKGKLHTETNENGVALIVHQYVDNIGQTVNMMTDFPMIVVMLDNVDGFQMLEGSE